MSEYKKEDLIRDLFFCKKDLLLSNQLLKGLVKIANIKISTEKDNSDLNDLKKELQEAIDYCDEKINEEPLLENNLKTVAKEGEKEAQIKLESCVNSIKNFQAIIKLVKKQIEELKKIIKDKKDYENLVLKRIKENEKRIEHLECRMNFLKKIKSIEVKK